MLKYGDTKFLVCEMKIYTPSFLAFDYFEMSVSYKKNYNIGVVTEDEINKLYMI